MLRVTLHKKRSLSLLISALVVLAMSLSACGGSQQGAEDSEPHTHAEEGGEHTH